MTIAKDHDLVESEQFAKSLFMENPSLGIDDAARQIAKECRRALVKPAISEIRHSVREQILRAGASLQASLTQPRGITQYPRKPSTQAPTSPRFTNSPRLVSVPVPVQQPVEIKDKNIGFRVSTSKERGAFLSDWAENNPTATVAQARQALVEKFGQAMGTAYILSTMQIARRLHELPEPSKALEIAQEAVKQEPVTIPAPESKSWQDAAGTFAKALKEAGIKSLALKDDGTYTVEFFGKL